MDVLGIHGKRKSSVEFNCRLICKQRVPGPSAAWFLLPRLELVKTSSSRAIIWTEAAIAWGRLNASALSASRNLPSHAASDDEAQQRFDQCDRAQ